MEIKITSYPISDVIENLETKRMRINKDYQRSPGLWPISAKSYFIDTILEGFPYPQIYLYQSFDKDIKRPYSEIIDGQQRVTTISEFYNNRFKLTKESRNHKGLFYKDLDEDAQRKFLSSTIEAGIILSGTRAEILEMFRRMNAYTVPLNASEKRNAKFQGEFKWFCTELADTLGPFFEQFQVMSPKQMVRFLDVEFISELCLALDKGIDSRTPAKLDSLFAKYDDNFPERNLYYGRLMEFFDMFSSNFSELKGTKIVSMNSMHDLFIAATHLKYGIPGLEEEIGEKPIGEYFVSRDLTLSGLEKLSDAIEIESDENWVKEFATASKRSTTKKRERLIKIQFMIKALKGSI